MNINLNTTGSALIRLPDERLVAADMRIDGLPYVGVLNIGLKRFRHKSIFGWYLSIIIDFDNNAVSNGMPDKEHTRQMQDFSEILNSRLSGNSIHPNTLFLGRVTGNGFTEIMWYVNNPDIAKGTLQNLIESNEYTLEFDYAMTYDPEWEEAEYWLKNLNESSEL